MLPHRIRNATAKKCVLEPIEGVDVSSVLILFMSRSEVDDGGGTASGPIALHVEIVVIEPRSIAIVGEKDAFLVENQLDIRVEDVQVGTLTATQIEAGKGGQVREVDSSKTQHASYGSYLKEVVLLEEIGCHVQQGKASFRGDGYLTGGERVREERESEGWYFCRTKL